MWIRGEETRDENNLNDNLRLESFFRVNYYSRGQLYVYSGLWHTASTLLPSGSNKKAP